MSRHHLMKLLALCLISLMLASCAGRRAARNMPSCSVPAAGACKACRIACPVGQTPSCTIGQGDEKDCKVPASCTCS